MSARLYAAVMRAEQEMSITEFRAKLADVIYAASFQNTVTYLTNHGRRVAALVPLPDAKATELGRENGPR